jgi:hypothetical protein
MTYPKNHLYKRLWKVKPADPDSADNDESLPAHIAQDMAFCEAMRRAGYRLVELEEVRK